MFYQSCASAQKVLKFDFDNSVELKFEELKFDRSKAEIKYNKDSIVYLIDNYIVYGTDGLIPDSKLSLAEIRIFDKTISLNTSGMYDPMLDLIDSNNIALVSVVEGEFTLRCVFSNGAGVYGVEWKVFGSKSFLTLITNDRKILDSCFLCQPESIDPEPEY